MYRTPTTSGASPKRTTPNPANPPTAAPDAAKTFIRRPERKRRSVDNMEAYKTEDYSTHTTDKLLQDVMKTFEDIPSKVKEYPQMRKDIKTFLEGRSDRGLRMMFEMCKRVKGLEVVTKTHSSSETDVAPTPSKTEDHILDKLGEVEAKISKRLEDLEGNLTKSFEAQKNTNDCGADMIDRIIDKIDEAKATIDWMSKDIQVMGREQTSLGEKIGGVVDGVATASDTIKEVLKRRPAEHQTTQQTYASVAAAKPGRRPALHSIAVTLEGSLETADEVLARVKEAVDARGSGIKINKVRKAKNQTVILGCDTEDELNKVKAMIEIRGEGLKVAPMKNKDPLVVLKDVFLDSEDDDMKMISALYTQNRDIFDDLPEEDLEMTIKYKKRTRNPKTAHVVVQVRPILWQKMTGAGAVYLDLQRVKVEDQSPLIQCTKCLAFGHGRKFCTESVDKCSHCGGPHLREICADFMVGSKPQCCNCSHSKLQKTDHNAFSVECPVRQKWDYLARASTAYI